MTQPVIFISYSRKDERDKDKLLSHLGVLQREGLIDLWNDDRIVAGADWQQEMAEAIARANVAILLISANYLVSDFISDKEVPALLKRREEEGLTIFPVIARPCAWKEVGWLARLSVRPRNGQPIWKAGSRRVDEELAALAKEVAAIVKRPPPPPPAMSGVSGNTPRVQTPNEAPAGRSQAGSPPISQPGARGPQVQLPQTGLEPLEPQHLQLIQQLYPGLERVIIEAELKGGYGGARVLLAQPITSSGRPIARQIIKLGHRLELQPESENFSRWVKNELPLMAARINQYNEAGELAGITYTFMGDGMLGRTRTLADYYQEAEVSPERFGQTLRELLESGLGQSWYQHHRPHICTFAEEYGPHLAEHLRLQLRPASADGVWVAAQAPFPIKSYSYLNGDRLIAEHSRFLPGSLVHLEGLALSRVKAHELKLHHPNLPGVVVKVAWPEEESPSLAFTPGQPVIVRGVVSYNRQQRLEELVATAFASFPEARVAVQQETLAWEGRQYPNPLKLYPQLLDQVLRGKKSMVHGDLHLRNVLVDQSGRGWLIDFARVTERHNLYDFIKMETYIRQMILGRESCPFSFAAYLQFEEALAALSLGQPATPPGQPDLARAYQAIRVLREIGSHYMGYPADFRGEYLPALLLYNLAVLKYQPNHGNKAARLAFTTAAVVGQALGGGPMPPPSGPTEVKSRTSSVQEEEVRANPVRPVDFVLITPLAEERDAILELLPGYRTLGPLQDDIHAYYYAELPTTFPDGSGGQYKVIIMPLLQMGRVQATASTKDAIRQWGPRYVLLAGIAGGFGARGVRLGDVLISDQIVDYELQKITPNGPEVRWEVYRPDPRLIAATQNFRGLAWQQLPGRPRPGTPQVHFGPILSGDKVIAAEELLRNYSQVWPKLVGVEMEAGGVALSAFQTPNPPKFFMIRGVSDLADEQKGTRRVEAWRTYACKVAAAYTIELLKSGPVPL